MELRSPHSDPYSDFNQTIDKLKEEGYTREFTVEDEGSARAGGQSYQPDDLVINGIYRFKGRKDWFTTRKTVVEHRVVYALDANDGQRGYLTADYDESGNEIVDKFLQNVDRHDKLHSNYN